MSTKKNFYIPGRPDYIYYDDGSGTKCWRKTGERTYDAGTIWEQNDVDSISTNLGQFLGTGKSIWVQNSCEECQTPGGIQMISVDWVASSVSISPDVHSLTNPSQGSAFYEISPFRNYNYVKGADDSDGDGVDDSVIGPGLAVSVTCDQSYSFAEIFGAIAPIKYGVSPPEVGFVDPLSASSGFYSIESDEMISFNVYMEAAADDREILPGHPDYVNQGDDFDLFSIKNKDESAGIMVGVEITNAFNEMFPGNEYNPSPTAPPIHPIHQAPAFFAMGGLDQDRLFLNVNVDILNKDFHRVEGVGSGDQIEGAGGRQVAMGDRWKKLKSGGDANNPADWEGEEGQYSGSTSGARLFQAMGFPNQTDVGNWDQLP